MMQALRDIRALPAPLRAYLIAWYFLGAAALLLWALQFSVSDGRSILCFIAISLVLNFKTVRGARKGSANRTTVSVASAASFAAIVSLGPLAGVPVEIFSNLVDSVYPKRRPLYQALFNISVCSVAALGAGFTYAALGGIRLAFAIYTPTIGLAAAAGPILVASVAYFAINTTGVAEVVALASGDRAWDTWKRNFSTSFIGYTAAAACVVMVLGLSGHMSLIPLITLTGPILYACHSREQSDEARVRALEKGKERLEGMYMASIRTLAMTVAAKDRYTSGHVHRVAAYAAAIAARLGLSEEEITEIRTGALLHDIGKIGVPEYILTKPGRLTDDEMAAMRRHSDLGWAILEPIGFPETVMHIVRHHHEWFNGCGYPDGLTGDAVPLVARIVSVSDVFDALTSARPYRGAMSEADAREILRRSAGSQFDPTVLHAFLEALDEVPYQVLSRVESDSPVLTEILDALHAATHAEEGPAAPPTGVPALAPS